MAQPETPRGAKVHKKRIASDTAEWHRRLDELAEIRREAAKSGLFEMTAGKSRAGSKAEFILVDQIYFLLDRWRRWRRH